MKYIYSHWLCDKIVTFSFHLQYKSATVINNCLLNISEERANGEIAHQKNPA